MTKLGQLREAEEKAQLEIEKAEKEAQKIRLSIPELKEEESRQHDLRLKEIASDEERKVEKLIEDLSRELREKGSEKLSKLAVYRTQLEEAAVNSLRDFIRNSGQRNS